MDKERQIRLLIPPFFLIASLLWGAFLAHKLDPYLHPTPTETVSLGNTTLQNEAPPALRANDTGKVNAVPTQQAVEAVSWKPLLSLLAVVGVSTLPVGYAIGVLTISFFRIVGWIISLFKVSWIWEIPITKEDMDTILEKLKVTDAKKAKYQLQAATIFDHVMTRPQIHSWLLRRWNSFMISAQCAAALSLSLLMGPAFGIPRTCSWLMTCIGLCGFFIWNAKVSWEQARDMFGAALEIEKAQRPPESRAKAQG
jgi:hypothetical protein